MLPRESEKARVGESERESGSVQVQNSARLTFFKIDATRIYSIFSRLISICLKNFTLKSSHLFCYFNSSQCHQGPDGNILFFLVEMIELLFLFSVLQSITGRMICCSTSVPLRTTYLYYGMKWHYLNLNVKNGFKIQRNLFSIYLKTWLVTYLSLIVAIFFIFR